MGGQAAAPPQPWVLPRALQAELFPKEWDAKLCGRRKNETGI